MASRTKRVARSGSWVVLAFIAGCTEPEVPPAAVTHFARIEVVYAPPRIELVSSDPIAVPEHEPPALPSEPTDLRWELADESGAIVASGSAPDLRTAHFESFGEPGDTRVTTESATLGADVPDVDGTFRLFASDGTPLGEMRVEARAGRRYRANGAMGKADIDFSTDVIGSPVVVAGDERSEGRFNLLFLPEGYRRSELETFHRDVRVMLDGLRETPGYTENFERLNAWYQDIQSADSGISEPGARAKDTAFNVDFGDDRARPRRCTMFASNWNAKSVANIRHFREMVRADVVVVVTNTGESSGCARFEENLVVQAGHSAGAGSTLAHEIAHALFFLGDEYQTGGSLANNTCTTNRINLTRSLTEIPWSDLIRPGTRLPTTGSSPDLVGAFEGGGFCDRGVYRPQHACLMRSLDARFCAVCMREVQRRFEQLSHIVRRVRITNRTGKQLFARCVGPLSPRCTTVWTAADDGQSMELELLEGNLAFHSSLPELSSWSTAVFAAPAVELVVYANAASPFTPPAPLSDAGVFDAGVFDAGAFDAGTIDPDAGVDGGSTGCDVSDLVVNEVQTAGASASDEFVEIVNPCSMPIDASGVTLVYRSAAGTRDTVLSDTLGMIGPRSVRVGASSGFGGASDLALRSGLGAAGGAVGLRDSTGTLVDAVGWGTATNALVEGRVARAPGAGESISRRDAADSGDNGADFTVLATPTPGMP